MLRRLSSALLFKQTPPTSRSLLTSASIPSIVTASSSSDLEPQTLEVVHVLVLGDTQVGKTSLIKLLLHQTSSDVLAVPVLGTDRICKLSLIEVASAGLEGLPSQLEKLAVVYAIIMYDITSKNSWSSVARLHKKLLAIAPRVRVGMILGNKLDKEMEISEKERVKPHKVAEFANHHQMLFYEISTDLDHSIATAVAVFAQRITTFLFVSTLRDILDQESREFYLTLMREPQSVMAMLDSPCSQCSKQKEVVNCMICGCQFCTKCLSSRSDIPWKSPKKTVHLCKYCNIKADLAWRSLLQPKSSKKELLKRLEEY